MAETYYFKISVPNRDMLDSFNNIEDWSKKYGLMQEIIPKKAEYFNCGLVKYISFSTKGDIRKFRSAIIKKGLQFNKIRGNELPNFNLEKRIR